MSYDSAESQWKLTSGERYFWLRGLTPTEPKPDPLTGVFQPLAGGVTEGALVRLALPLHNYSLDKSVDDVVVAFAYQKLDPQTSAPVGDFVEFARSKPVTIGPRGVATVDVIWNTTGLGGSGAGFPYRFKVIVDPDNEIKNKLHGNDPKEGANTIGLWPWNTGFWVFHTRGRADGGGVRPGGVRLGLNVTEGLEGPRGSSMADMASVTIDMPASDSALRHLIVSGVTPDGERIALAARSLFGLGPGPQRLEIPLSAHSGLSRLQAWLSAGALSDEPLTGTWVTDDPAARAFALSR
jgi:hypothetical protein